jgi:hypothetical protein
MSDLDALFLIQRREMVSLHVGLLQAILVAVIGAAAPTVAIFAHFIFNRRALSQIHTLVNNQLDRALDRVDALKKELESLKKELDERNRLIPDMERFATKEEVLSINQTLAKNGEYIHKRFHEMSDVLQPVVTQVQVLTGVNEQLQAKIDAQAVRTARVLAILETRDKS